MRDTLQVKGYQTIETETDEEGVRLARERHPALVLMDIQLPGIIGVAYAPYHSAARKRRSYIRQDECVR